MLGQRLLGVGDKKVLAGQIGGGCQGHLELSIWRGSSHCSDSSQRTGKRSLEVLRWHSCWDLLKFWGFRGEAQAVEDEDIKELRGQSVGRINIWILKPPKTMTAVELENSNEPRANIKIF